MTKYERELIEINKEIAIAGDLEWSIVIESIILNTYRYALKQGQALNIDDVSKAFYCKTPNDCIEQCVRCALIELNEPF